MSFLALSGRESSLVQTFCESCEQLDITQLSVHMTQRFVIQGCSTLLLYLQPRGSYSILSCLQFQTFIHRDLLFYTACFYTYLLYSSTTAHRASLVCVKQRRGPKCDLIAFNNHRIPRLPEVHQMPITDTSVFRARSGGLASFS